MYRILPIFCLLLSSCVSDRREVIPDEVFDPPVLISAPDSDKELFVWDFSSPRIYVYELRNKTTTAITANTEMEVDFNLTMEMVQEVEVRTTGDHTAELVMVSAEVDETSGMPGMGALLQKSMEENLPRSMGQVHADGSPIGDEVLGELVFYLPERDLKPGERDTIQSSIQLDSMAVNLDIDQSKVITFVGYEEYEGRNCAVLVVNQLNEDGTLKVEEEDVDFSAAINLSSGSRFYFDVERHYFLAAEVISDGELSDLDLSTLDEEDEGETSFELDVRSIQHIKLVDIRANE